MCKIAKMQDHAAWHLGLVVSQMNVSVFTAPSYCVESAMSINSAGEDDATYHCLLLCLRACVRLK